MYWSFDFNLMDLFRVLHLSSSGFAPLQKSLNIHAHRLNYILFDKITWNRELKLLLQIEENQLPEVLAITNSKIKTLGEINISSRYVSTFNYAMQKFLASDINCNAEHQKTQPGINKLTFTSSLLKASLIWLEFDPKYTISIMVMHKEDKTTVVENVYFKTFALAIKKQWKPITNKKDKKKNEAYS